MVKKSKNRSVRCFKTSDAAWDRLGRIAVLAGRTRSDLLHTLFAGDYPELHAAMIKASKQAKDSQDWQAIQQRPDCLLEYNYLQRHQITVNSVNTVDTNPTIE